VLFQSAALVAEENIMRVVNIERFMWGLTPELSRVAKQLRLE
jgi:hypothetical protein